MFIYDNTGFSNQPKVDYLPVPAGANATNFVQAADWQQVLQALLDIQTWARGSKWDGLSAQASDPAPAGITNYVWLDTSNRLWLKAGTNIQILSSANLTTDASDLTILNNASAAAPATASTSKLYSSSQGGRPMLGEFPSYGSTPWQFQPHAGRRCIRYWKPRSATTTVDVLGCSFSTGAGTLTSKQPGPTPASLFASLVRIQNLSGATGTSVASNYDSNGYACWRGNAAGQGGFHLIFRWGISDAVLNANARMFVGLMSNVAVASDPGNPSTLTQILGVGCDATDTALQLYSAGTAAQARVSFGSNFPVNTVSTDIFELQLFCAPNDTQVFYNVNRFTTSQIAPAFSASGSVTGTTAQLIAAGTMFMPYIWRSCGGTATAVAYDLMSMYLESDL